MTKAHPASPAARQDIVLGVVGGSGLYSMPGLDNVREESVQTPFGEPSGNYVVGELARTEGRKPVRVVFLPRHGVGHVLLPSEINFRANVHGFKQLGVTHLLSVSAVGSLREEIAPGHVVTPDQYLDRTKSREATFFGGGAVAHVQFGEPTCAAFRGRVGAACRAEGATLHDKGTCIVMEGPMFSTRAESEFYRSLGAHVIGMTALPEAKLAREAEIAYAMLALSTDYDCWRVGEEEVSVEGVVAVMKKNIELAQRVVARVARELPEHERELPWPRACEHALMTSRELIPAVTRARLDLIVGHYLERGH